MRFIGRSAVVALTLAVIFGIGSSSAFAANVAPGWIVNEAFIGEGETKEVSAVSTSELVLSAELFGVEFSFSAPAGDCTLTGSIKGTAAESADTLEGSLKCTSAVVKGPPSCKVNTSGQPTGTIVSNALKGTLVWRESTGPPTGLLVKPVTGASLINLQVTGCAVAGTYPLENEAIAKFEPVEEEVVPAVLSLPEAPILNWWSNAETRAKQTINQTAIFEEEAFLKASFKFELQGGGKVAAGAKRKRTILCKEGPNPFFFPSFCRPGETYGASQAIAGSDESPAQPAVGLELLPAPVTTISCGTTSLAAETLEASGNPLHLGSFALTFAGCETGTHAVCTTTVMTNSPANATLAFTPILLGSGVLKAPLTLRFKCGAGLNCKWSAGSFKFSFHGAKVATIASDDKLPTVALGEMGEAGCHTEARFTSTFAISTPLAVWVEGKP